MSKPVDCMEKCAVSGLRELEVLFPFLFFVFYNGKERQTPQCKLLAPEGRGSFESVLSEVGCEEMPLITGHLCQLPAANRFQLPSPEKNRRCSVSRSQRGKQEAKRARFGSEHCWLPSDWFSWQGSGSLLRFLFPLRLRSQNSGNCSLKHLS